MDYYVDYFTDPYEEDCEDEFEYCYMCNGNPECELSGCRIQNEDDSNL